MIAVPEGWRRLATVGADVFANADQTIQVRYTSRIAPLRPFASVRDAALAALPEWHSDHDPPRTRFVTHEGEYAFGAAARGRWQDRPAERFIGAVYGDDFMNVIDALALGPSSQGAFEREARGWLASATLLLGIRRRRCFYARPAGWHGHATGLTTHWFPALFPARPATIVVYPANPTNESPMAVAAALVQHEQQLGTRVAVATAPEPITARDHLDGLHWTMTCVAGTGEAIHRDLVVLARRPFTYAIQLDAFGYPDPEARLDFLTLVRSLEPIPAAGSAIASGDDPAAFAHYL